MTPRITQITAILTGILVGTAPALASQLVEKVTGEGQVHSQTYSYRYEVTMSVAVAAFEDEDGRIWGTVTGRTDGHCLLYGGASSATTFTADIDCVDIVLNEAWVYAVVTNPGSNFFPGNRIVVYIRDLGQSGTDRMYLGALDNTENCADSGCGTFPNVMCCQYDSNDSAPTLVSGNFTVRTWSTKPEPAAEVGTWSMVKRLYQ